jgi:parvulin-like peptidyl-prolyl isomerase
VTTAIIAAVIAVTGSAFAQTVDQVLQADLQRLNLAQASQQRVNEVVEGTRTLADQYRAINKEIDGLRVYNRLMTAQTNGQRATLDDIALSMDQVEVVNRQIFPLMERMIDGLEQSIALDIPFLMDERSARIETLKDLMSRSDVSVAEKFRKVLEAYQIEMDYGTSSEWYRQTLEVEGVEGSREYNMLRVGRVGLYFQSDDAQVTGYYDPGQNGFVRDNGYRSEIRKGVRMARQLIAPELILVPVQAAEPIGESS